MNRPARGARFPAVLHAPAATGSQRRSAEPASRGAAAREQPPSQPRGLGLDTAAVRLRMVAQLERAGVRNDVVLRAMAALPRHQFVDTALAAQSYEDTSLPIGHGQTISKPSVVARMLEWLFLGERARRHGHLGQVLEIGTGCGYQTALLAMLARQVVSVERVRSLHEAAQENLREWRGQKVRLVYGDGMHGHAPNAPYDSIIAAAGGDDLPDAWLQQLAIGGRLIAPAATPDGSGQVLVIVDRSETGWHRSTGEGVRFVPLKSGYI